MSEWICKNCGNPMKVKWNDELGYLAEHYDLNGDCAFPTFSDEDAAILDNDYPGDEL